MTDRLTTLMHDEVARLEVPPPPAARIIADGRTLRRRRTTGLVAGAAAVVLVAVAVTASALQGSDRDSIEPADRISYLENGAWAQGDEVHIGDRAVTVPDASTLAYTSLGAVIGTSTGEFSLVTPDGRTHPLGLDLARTPLPGEVSTDPATPYLAYVRAVDDRTGQLVVRDLGTGEETTVGDPISTIDGGGEVTQLWGDVLFWFPRGNGKFINWRTGAELPFPEGLWTIHSLAAGSALGFDNDNKSWVVTSRTDGATLLSVPAPEPASASTATLSLDGRYLAVAGQTPEITVYDVATRRQVSTFEDRVLSGYSWTPDGHLVGKAHPRASTEVETCDPATGTCTGTGIEVSEPLTLVPAPASPFAR